MIIHVYAQVLNIGGQNTVGCSFPLFPLGFGKRCIGKAHPEVQPYRSSAKTCHRKMVFFLCKTP